MRKTDRNSIILAILIMIQPILDMGSYFGIRTGIDSVMPVLRLILFGAIMLYAFILSDRKKPYYIFALVVGAYFIIRVLLCARNGYNLVSDVKDFLRTLQMPALTLAFITLFQHAKDFPGSMGKFFAVNYVTIAVSILLSYAVGYPAPTYVATGVGIKGWFYAGNAQSCILSIMAMPALCYFYQKNNNLLFVLTLLLACTLMFLLGTLVATWSIFVICIIFLVLILWNREKKWIIAGVLVAMLVATFVALPYSPSTQNSTNEQYVQMEWEAFLGDQKKDPDETPGDGDTDDIQYDLKDTLLEPLVERFGYDKVLDVYGGEITAADLMDVRQVKVAFGRLVMAERDVWTWLFGIEEADITYDGTSYYPENDFPSIFFFYGIVGICLYVAFLAYFAWILLKDIFKSLKKLPVKQTILGLDLVLAMGIAQMSAHVLSQPNASIYISLMLAYAYYICKIRKGDDHESECNCSGL